MFNYIKHTVVALGMLSSAVFAMTPQDAQHRFNAYTETYTDFYIERDARNINKTLAENAALLAEIKGIDAPIALSVDDAWNAELHKAYDPLAYIPFAVLKQAVVPKDGADFNVNFWRLSVQRDFRDPKNLVYVKEDVYIDHQNKKITFLGVPFEAGDLEILGAYEELTLENVAPLFSVEHAIETHEGEPFDTWRIVRMVEGEEDPQIMVNLRAGILNPEKMAASVVHIYGEEMRRMLSQ